MIGTHTPAKAPPQINVRTRIWPTRIALIAILLIGAYFRMLSLFAWDEPSIRLHPDERFFTNVASQIQLPSSFGEYLDSERNPLNPRNYSQSTFYVYGLLPQTLTQLTAVMLTPDSALAPCVNRPDVPAPDLVIGQPCGDPTVLDAQTKIANNDLNIPKLTLLQRIFNPDGLDLTQYYEIHKVGRAWSVLFDLGSILLTFLIGRRLYGRRVGLVAALLLALSVLPIQLAHFFTVDAATAFFVLLSVYWGVRCAQNGGVGSFAALGLAIGGAMACRVTLATLGLVGVLAVAARLWQARQEKHLQFASLYRLVALLTFAGVLAALTFRLLQPDAFQGKSFFDVRPEPRFISNIQQIAMMVGGEGDAPPNQQWAGRVPFLFPLQNMILWGFGLPLGVAALVGWLAAGWQLVRRKNLAHLIPWGWVTFYFLWQGGQFVTTMRYYSSLYGLLALLAAWALVRVVAWRPRSRARLRFALSVAPLVAVVAGTTLWAFAFTRIYTHPHSRIEASRWIFDNIPAGSTITSEEWDDGLPLGLDGRDAGQYVSLLMRPYGEDEPSKYFGQIDSNGVLQPGMLDQLDQANYLIFSSNRVYDSTKRLPMKYPALTRYWNALFEGKLGFRLVADLHSYPTLFGIEIPTPILAEEAFSVYDHPRVLIFEKTTEYSRANAEALITGDVAWGEVYKVTSFVGGKVPTALRLTEAQWEGYRAGGAGIAASLFGSIAPWLAWLLALELVGLAAFVLLFHMLPGLADRGFALAKTAGVLVVAWLAWLLASVGASDGVPLMSFSPASVWLCAALLIVPAGLVAWRSQTSFRAFWRERCSIVIAAEAVFLLAFFGFLVIRALNPDLWHDARGGEKPMDLAFLTATLKSAAFPPYDPWFAGGYINYYYFGFVFVGALVHMSGVAPTVAYNLAVPTIFALTALGGFGVGLNLALMRSRGHSISGRMSRFRPIALGVAAAVFVTTLGPLTQTVWLLPGSADTTDPGISAECLVAGSYAEQQACRGRSEWAFWDATRIVGMANSRTGEYDGTINEFPFFTFLFGDLHAHMIALPLALLVVSISLAFVVPKRTRSGQIAAFALLALAVGALATTNTWDYPTYLGVGALTLGIAAWQRWQRGGLLLRELGVWALASAALLVLARLLFLPFHQHFATEYAGFELWSGARTGAGEFLKINGVWLGLLLIGVLDLYRRRGVRSQPLALVGVATVAASVIVAWLGLTALVLIVPMLGVAVGVLIDMLFRQRTNGEPPPSAATVLPVLWACAALGLCFLPEIVVAKGDIGRMNTVFKLGMQSWTLFALSGAFVFTNMFWQPTRTRQQARAVRRVSLRTGFQVAAAVLVLAAFAYPLTATPARIADRFDPQIAPTLDGAAYMASPNAHWNENGRDFSFAEDANALDWMRRNISGAPIVLEAQSEGYRWAGRVSIYTGLPTLLGWPWHETQQRSATRVQPVLENRRLVVQQLYNSTDETETLKTLHTYGVEYVYVGQLEQALYDATGLAKFEQMAQSGALERVYASGQTRIYRALDPQNPPAVVTTSLPVVAPSLPSEKTAMLDRPVGMLPQVNEYAWNSIAQGQPMAVVLWLLVWVAFGALGLPVAALVFWRWRDGGLAFAPLIGLLLLGYMVWLPVSSGLWQYNLLGVVFGALLVLLVDLGALWLHWRARASATEPDRGGPLRVFAADMRARLRPALLVGGLWLGAFATMALVRALNPDLWQPSWGGEKPFEFGFLNAILRSPVMPPYNPFYSDGTINYYYYGLYLVSLPIKITGIAPAVGFNLALATLFSMTLVGAFSIVRRLAGRIRYGLIGAAFVTFLGNLAAVFPTKGSWSSGLAPVADAFSNGIGRFGQQLDAWFVGPSRVIPFTINEFPFWSFLFADLHPHLIALPITLLATALAFTLIERRPPREHMQQAAIGRRVTIGMVALVLGALAVTNSWDFPTYTLLIAAALIGAVWLERRTRGVAFTARLLVALGTAAGVAVAALLLYLPFFQNFMAMVGGIGFVRGGTMPESYAVIYGLFLVVLVPWLVMALLQGAIRAARQPERVPSLPKGALGIVATQPTNLRRYVPFFLMALVLFSVLVAALNRQNPAMLKLVLGAAFLGCVVLLFNRRLAPATWFALALAVLGFAVSIGVDLVYIRDHLAGDPANPGEWYRMNTVFKFGYQVWVLLALAAASSLPLVLRGLRRANPVAEMVFTAAVTVVAMLALVFPLVGTPSRVAYRFPESPQPTLDGLGFLDSAVYDWNGNVIDLSDDGEAIRWLNQNVQGTPVVLQSSMEFYRAYGVRVAANTGLPTVVSPLHESEQRDGALVGARDTDVIDFYRTSDIAESLRILSKYRVGYVVVGPIERAAYGEAGMTKFAELANGYLTPVFQNASVTIYKVSDAVYSRPVSEDASVITIEPQPIPVPQQPTTPVDEAALAQLEAEHAAEPTAAGPAFSLGERYRNLGRLDEAAEVLRVAAAANLADVPLHHLWGDTLRDAGRFDEAEAAYRAAAQAQPNAGNYNKLGSELTRMGKLEQAEIALNEAIRLDAQAAEPYYRLGEVYEQQKLTAQAVEYYQRYLDLEPQGVFAELARAALERLTI